VCSIGALSYTVVVVVYSSVQHILQNPQTLHDVEWGFNLNLGEASQALPVVRALTQSVCVYWLVAQVHVATEPSTLSQRVSQRRRTCGS
jgi:hypothetical protein